MANPAVLAFLGYAYRRARSAGYWLLNPIDAAFRRLNGIGQYPPIYLRRHAGCLGGFDGSGYEFVAYLKLLSRLGPEHRLWDLGCGCGLLELALESVGWRGAVVGVDIHKPSIRWAQRTISRRLPTSRFVHADIHNLAYWPQGRTSALQWFANFPEGDFDHVIAKSLFTHMLPDEIDTYLGEISARLRASGKALLTFFLLNPDQQDRRERNAISFARPNATTVFAVRSRIAPTAAVAYEEQFLAERLQKNRLQVDAVHYGSWTGRADGLSFQDVIVASKR